MFGTPIAGGLGVLIQDVDLTRPLSDDQVLRFRDLFAEHMLIVARGQALKDEDHDRLVGYLGPLQTFDHGAKFEYISNVQEDNPNMAGTGRLLFHNDGAYRPRLRAGTSLYALLVSPSSPPTAFASGVAAYERLSNDLKQKIQDLHAMHILDMDRDQEYRRVREADLPCDVKLADLKHAVHPVVVCLPRTQRKALFVSEFYTSHIVEYGPNSAEGEDLLQQLFGVLYADDNVYAHHYQVNDLVVWDNWGMQHARTASIDDSTPRHLRRLVLESLYV